MKNLTKAAIAVFFTLLAFFVSVYGIEEKLAAKFPAFAPYSFTITIAMAVITGLFVLSLFFHLIISGFERIQRIRGTSLRNTTISKCAFTDLPDIHKLAAEKVGGVSDLQQTQLLYNHNKECFRKIIDVKTQAIIGYFCVIPLTNKGVSQVESRHLLSGNIDLDHFAKRFGKGSSVYIGSIAGANLKGAAAAVEQLKIFLLNKNCLKAYARPMTDHGVRLVKAHGFDPVSSHDRLESGVFVYKLRQI
jgi:hypothetical protein